MRSRKDLEERIAELSERSRERRKSAFIVGGAGAKTAEGVQTGLQLSKLMHGLFGKSKRLSKKRVFILAASTALTLLLQYAPRYIDKWSQKQSEN